ncbi:hypothetical protein PUNSTDRAFT_134314 [Punctularia strigosozonata HHB-11173 SS5]|uniref:uncharacterized protein n=1 Tax=Punctularia strigosozonata (strain HHB-11173) TaxID=741275 RepID=UPI0004417F2B|nr:uncharacterized protein PUNSTDRAFT_134314 [Punctularia strigosozonata HHB-11173 SS5]EIN09150.1 hypothetical protein PUNSTDRAFT_134314 [Punctularia strigosozonata HHB-11173 SS5]
MIILGIFSLGHLVVGLGSQARSLMLWDHQMFLKRHPPFVAFPAVAWLALRFSGQCLALRHLDSFTQLVEPTPWEQPRVQAANAVGLGAASAPALTCRPAPSPSRQQARARHHLLPPGSRPAPAFCQPGARAANAVRLGLTSCPLPPAPGPPSASPGPDPPTWSGSVLHSTLPLPFDPPSAPAFDPPPSLSCQCGRAGAHSSSSLPAPNTEPRANAVGLGIGSCPACLRPTPSLSRQHSWARHHIPHPAPASNQPLTCLLPAFLLTSPRLARLPTSLSLNLAHLPPFLPAWPPSRQSPRLSPASCPPRRLLAGLSPASSPASSPSAGVGTPALRQPSTSPKPGLPMWLASVSHPVPRACLRPAWSGSVSTPGSRTRLPLYSHGSVIYNTHSTL